MKKSTRKHKVLTRFKQSPAKLIHKNAQRNSEIKNQKQPGPTIIYFQKKSQKKLSIMNLQVDWLLSKNSNGEL